MTKAGQFVLTFRNGKRITTKYFTVTLHHNNIGHARLGLAISRRNAPHASQRNRIKRLVRETFRLQQQNMRAVDIALQAQPLAATTPNTVLRRSLQAIWTDPKIAA